MKILKIYIILEKNAKWFLKKTPNYCTNLFVLFSICFIIVYKFFFFENEKRSKHFLKLSFLLIFQIKSFFKFLSKWVKAKMNMEEKKLQTKQKSNTRKIQLQVNLCQNASFPKYFTFTNFDLSCGYVKLAGSQILRK